MKRWAQRKEGGQRSGVRERRPLSDMRGLLPRGPPYMPPGQSQGPTLVRSNYHGPLAQPEGRQGLAQLPPNPLPLTPRVPCRVSHICTYWCFPTHHHSLLPSALLLQGHDEHNAWECFRSVGEQMQPQPPHDLYLKQQVCFILPDLSVISLQASCHSWQWHSAMKT